MSDAVAQGMSDAVASLSIAEVVLRVAFVAEHVHSLALDSHEQYAKAGA